MAGFISQFGLCPSDRLAADPTLVLVAQFGQPHVADHLIEYRHRIFCLLRPTNLRHCRCHSRTSISSHVRHWLKLLSWSHNHHLARKFPSSSWAQSSHATSLRLGKLQGSTLRKKGKGKRIVPQDTKRAREKIKVRDRAVTLQETKRESKREMKFKT